MLSCAERRWSHAMTVLAHPDFLNAYNAKHVLHPMADPKAMRATPPVIIERGEGAHVFDTEGRRYLDCVASLWNVNVGHNRPEVKQAIVAQLDRIAYYSTFNGLSNPPSIELSVLLAELMAPEKMTKFFFSSGGSDAIESALKLARQYWKLEGKPERVKFISLRHGYHGVHFGGSSANGNPPFRRAFEPLMPNFFQVETPYLYRNPWSDDPEELAALCATMLEREIVHQGQRSLPSRCRARAA
ncbi:MAG: aminotransferase class III-fold pyridoxal phosphate-dependent enzyme [Proteobacteria bacterium]|nr:aminotransferase class III-fold pyridoxal phosphate-dependent enzyme [Pseudomonadota bacterium]